MKRLKYMEEGSEINSIALISRKPEGNKSILLESAEEGRVTRIELSKGSALALVNDILNRIE